MIKTSEILEVIHFLDTKGEHVYQCKEDLSPQTLKDLEFSKYKVRKTSGFEALQDGVKYIITWDDVKQVRLDFVSVRCDVLIVLSSKNDWIMRIPDHLPEKQSRNEVRLFVDANGSILCNGGDFESAVKSASYPVTVYRLKTATEYLNLTNKIEIK